LQTRGLAEDELSGLLGAYIPFVRTKAMRKKASDPRLSLQERYRGKNDYMRRIARAARILINQRYLLPEDAQRIIDAAKRTSTRLFHF
jgi:hypothetical protein